MKKILALILMMCVVCNVSVGAKTKKTTRKAKAKSERAMTDFEKWQKEECLAYIYGKFEHWYNAARALESRGHSNKDYINRHYRMAEIEKENYESVKNSNYYVDFNDYKQKYYTGGNEISIGIFYDEGARHYEEVNEWTSAEEVRLADELVDRINKEIGFNKEKVISERKSSLKEFATRHSGVEPKEITPHPTRLEREKANNDACKKHKEEAYTKYYNKETEAAYQNSIKVKDTKKNSDSDKTSVICGVINGDLADIGNNATVKAVHTATGTVFYAIADWYGKFSIKGMRPGEYTIIASCYGYNDAKTTINLEVGKTYNIDVDMK